MSGARSAAGVGWRNEGLGGHRNRLRQGDGEGAGVGVRVGVWRGVGVGLVWGGASVCIPWNSFRIANISTPNGPEPRVDLAVRAVGLCLADPDQLRARMEPS